jgi:hypothetical protein
MDRETENQELDLVEASRAGNRQSFGELVRHHQNLVCALAFSGLGDVAQSEDVAQEVFITACSIAIGCCFRDMAPEPPRERPWVSGSSRSSCRTHCSTPLKD